MQNALRVLEEQEAKLTLLRAAFIRGEDSGVTDRNVLDILAAVKEQSAATDKSL